MAANPMTYHIPGIIRAIYSLSSLAEAGLRWPRHSAWISRLTRDPKANSPAATGNDRGKRSIITEIRQIVVRFERLGVFRGP